LAKHFSTGDGSKVSLSGILQYSNCFITHSKYLSIFIRFYYLVKIVVAMACAAKPSMGLALFLRVNIIIFPFCTCTICRMGYEVLIKDSWLFQFSLGVGKGLYDSWKCGM